MEGTVRTILATSFLLGMLLLLAVPAPASDGFRGWATCNRTTPHDRDRVCHVGDAPAGVLRAPRGARDGERFRFCVVKPGGNQNCKPDRTKGKLSKTRFRIRAAGLYKLRWRMDGDRIAHARMRAKRERA